MKVFLFAKAAAGEPVAQLSAWFSTTYLDQLQQAGLPLQRYVLNICDIVPDFKISPFIATGPAHRPAYDLGIELWLDAEASAAAGQSADAANPELRAFFLTQAQHIQARCARLDIFFTSENVRYAPPTEVATNIKFMALGCWADHLSSDEGRQYWTEHAKLVPRIHVGVNKYVQNWVEDSLLPGAPTVSGIAELHFPSLEKMESEFYNSVEGQSEIRQDVARFTKSAITLFAHEELIYQKV